MAQEFCFGAGILFAKFLKTFESLSFRSRDLFFPQMPNLNY
jgi:hypothetical protein